MGTLELTGVCRLEDDVIDGVVVADKVELGV